MPHSEQQRLLEAVRQAVRHELSDRSSIKKNGHTWAEYAGKLVTPERVLLAVIAVFTFGGDIRDARRDLANATKQAMVASTQAEKASQQSATSTTRAAETQQELAEVLKQLTAQAEAQSKVNDDVNNRLSLTLTRPEWRSAMTQQILPRLERIEKRLDQTRFDK